MKDKLPYKLYVKEIKTGYVRVRNVMITLKQHNKWVDRLDKVTDTGFSLVEIRPDYD